MSPDAVVPFYNQEPELALSNLSTSSEGLTPEEAVQRLQKDGPNRLPKGKRESKLDLLVKQLKDPLILVLIGSATLAVATGRGTDGLTVMAVVVANAWIGMAQELRARKAIDSLADMVPTMATVVRQGQEQALSAEQLVRGDIVSMQAGDKVPADVRLLQCHNFETDESALTGESAPVPKDVLSLSGEVALAERTNLAFSGCLVTRGSARGVVVAIGSESELGRINTMLNQTESLATPLTLQLEELAKKLTVGIVAVAVLLFGVCILRGLGWLDASLVALTLAVGAIPEGLPAIVTISLALGVRRMAARHAIIRHLPVVETLGSASVICSDKTGTLTCNQMTLREVWMPPGEEGVAARVKILGSGYQRSGEIDSNSPHFLEILRAGVLCNDSQISLSDDKASDWDIQGDPTEVALLVGAEKAGLRVDTVRQENPRIDYIPFESETRRMVSLHKIGEVARIYLKGAPEVVLRRCSQIDREAVDGQILRLAEQGMRVLAIASRVWPGTLKDEGWDTDFQFLGLLGMIDPPRPEAIESIKDCLSAGIQVKMITGDHPVTAGAIAKELGIVAAEVAAKDAAVTGKQLKGLDPTALGDLVMSHHVYARVEPEHKLAIVRALQGRGQVTAMTGDGVNDAPALRQADIGVAMGKGSAVSQEASGMVLTDDNFASIAAAVYEGRRVYDNLVKAVAFLLPVNLSLALVLLVAILFFPKVNGSPLLPMLPTQILWINLVASVLLSLPLALEAAEPNLMGRPPRKRGAQLLDLRMGMRTLLASVLMTGVSVAAFLLAFYGTSDDPAVSQAAAQTEAVTAMVMCQCIYLLQCRRLSGLGSLNPRKNPAVFAGILSILLLQLAFVYWNIAQGIFHTSPLKGWDWFQDAVAAVLAMPFASLVPITEPRQVEGPPANVKAP